MSNGGHKAFLSRRDAWCKATGLQVSKARITAALPWVEFYRVPQGFDHTHVFYYPQQSLHVLITEPYHSIETALDSIYSISNEKSKLFSYAIGDAGSGLWYPGSCMPLLLAKHNNSFALRRFANALPTAA